MTAALAVLSLGLLVVGVIGAAGWVGNLVTDRFGIGAGTLAFLAALVVESALVIALVAH